MTASLLFLLEVGNMPMRNTILYFVSTLLCLSLYFQACVHEPTNPQAPPIARKTVSEVCDEDSVYFDNTVLPIFRAACANAGCHDEQTARNGVKLSDYRGILAQVTPGEPGMSNIMEVIEAEASENRMPPPPSPALAEAQIQQIKQWIAQGARNNACPENEDDCDTSNVGYQQLVLPILRNQCLDCHRTNTADNLGGGNVLEGYANLKKYVDNGKLYQAIAHLPGATPMPYGQPNPIDTCSVRQIKKWIDNGAPNN